MKFSIWFLSTDTTHSGEIGTKKKVKRLLSFQRYFHASRLLRGIIPQAPLHLLDEDYLGQARVSQLPPTGSGQGPVTQLTAPGLSPTLPLRDCVTLGWVFNKSGLTFSTTK